MLIVNLTHLSQSEFVIHFGGRSNEVDAYTFSNCLLELAEAMRGINSQINPDFGIEVTIEGIGPGSFRAGVRTILKSIGNLFKSDVRNVVVGVISSFIFFGLHQDNQAKIIVN